jgi:hypothetical protein
MSLDLKFDHGHGSGEKRQIVQRRIGTGFLDERPTTPLEMLRISSVLIANLGSKSMTISIPIMSKTVRGNKTILAKVLLDTGAGGLFLDKKYADKHKIIPQKLPI